MRAAFVSGEIVLQALRLRNRRPIACASQYRRSRAADEASNYARGGAEVSARTACGSRTVRTRP